MTIPRLRMLKPYFEKLVKKGVGIFIITRYPNEHDDFMAEQSEAGIHYFEGLGAQVLLYEGHHRKLSMIDRKLLWEGSLNILSQTHSREFMSKKVKIELLRLLNLIYRTISQLDI